MKLKIAATILILMSLNLMADCVYGAKDKNKFNRIDSNTIILSGTFGNNILIKTYCSIYNSSNVQVLKDSFCSYESDVLYVDGTLCSVNQVVKVDR